MIKRLWIPNLKTTVVVQFKTLTKKKLYTFAYTIENVNTQLLYMVSAANTITLRENCDQPIKLVSEPWTVLNTYPLHLQIAVIKLPAFYFHNSSWTVQHFIDFFQWNKIKSVFANKVPTIRILTVLSNSLNCC